MINDKTDPLDELTEGDEVWFKNHYQKEHVRWIKATYLKRLSINTFQITIGSARIMAHRAQLRLCKSSSPPTRSNILVSVPQQRELPMGEPREEEVIGEVPGRPAKERRKRNAMAAGFRLSSYVVRKECEFKSVIVNLFILKMIKFQNFQPYISLPDIEY